MKRPALWLIRFYQMTWSQVFPPSCRYLPTCSQYTYEAIQKYGFFKGGVDGCQAHRPLSPLP